MEGTYTQAIGRCGVDPPELSRFCPNPLLRAELGRRIEEYVGDVLVAVLGNGVSADDVPRSVTLGLAERCWKQIELLSRKAEGA